MGRRTVVVFWGAVAAAVFFLGSGWTAAAHMGSGPYALANAAVLGVSVIGFAGTTLVAGRIAFVVGRAQRHARRARGEGPIPAGDGQEA
jgi:hypothetical protein